MDQKPWRTVATLYALWLEDALEKNASGELTGYH